MEKIEMWRLFLHKDDHDAWHGEITVTLDSYDLSLLCGAIGCAHYEGRISDEERDYLFNKFNIVS